MPGEVVDPTVIFRVNEDDPPDLGVTVLDERDVVTPVGAPLTESDTAELKPLTEATVTVELP